MSNVIPLRPNMPVVPLMTMEEYRLFLTARRDELLKIGHKIITEQAYMAQQIDNLAARSNMVSNELLDCETRLGFLSEQVTA